MIAFDLVYRRPDSVEEAVEAWRSDPAGSLYYSGGTEVVTGCRVGTYRPAALIDLKGLPGCRDLGRRLVGGRPYLYFGAALSLNEIAEEGSFPLLSSAVRGVADHSVRNRITLGGNVAGRLPYREALLPFLAADGIAHLAGPCPSGGVAFRDVGLRELHDKRLRFQTGEFLLGLSVEEDTAALPSFHDRATAGAPVDYPILALCAIDRGGRIAVALSGYLDHPAWTEGAAWPSPGASFPPAREDQRASRGYRVGLLGLALARAAASLGQGGGNRSVGVEARR